MKFVSSLKIYVVFHSGELSFKNLDIVAVLLKIFLCWGQAKELAGQLWRHVEINPVSSGICGHLLR